MYNFHIGGNKICEKCLKDLWPKGGKNPIPCRLLNDRDLDHYQKIVIALRETICIMKEIDEVIDKHGRWPGEFRDKNERLRSSVRSA